MTDVYRQATSLACQTPKTSFWLVRTHPKTSSNKATDLLLYLGCRYARFFSYKSCFLSWARYKRYMKDQWLKNSWENANLQLEQSWSCQPRIKNINEICCSVNGALLHTIWMKNLIKRVLFYAWDKSSNVLVH